MAKITQETRLELEKSELVALRDRGPLGLCCQAGELWLTCEGVAGDIVLREGQSIEIEAGREAVLSAFCPSLLTIHRRGQTGELHVRLDGAAHARLAHLLRWSMPALCSLIPATHLR